MRVLHAAAEVYPLLKTGGLADVTGALPLALRAHGIDARLVLPGMPAILDGIRGDRVVAECGALFGAGRVRVHVGTLPGSSVPAYVIDAPWLYRRGGGPYADEQQRSWPDNPRRFALLGWVASHLAFGDLDENWQADVLHSHDWHAGLAPAYLAAHPERRVGTVHTVHNLAFQGVFALDEFRPLGLPPSALSPQGLEFYGQGNFMKAGLVWADELTTVSPRYAREIRTREFGCGLEGVLATRQDRLSGLLNGIDESVWNPATDAHLPAHFDVDQIRDQGQVAGKAECRKQLQRVLGLGADAEAPLFVVVSRLTDQKGMDLLLGALPRLLARGAQLALLGSGEPSLEKAFTEVARQWPRQVSVTVGYDEALSHRLIAGGDVIVVPSRFEPCGLTQMYGLRYGTLPLVRAVGGLDDTVQDATEVARASGHATGFVFGDASIDALAGAIDRAIDLYRSTAAWRALMRTAMRRDHSWSRACEGYEQLYRQVAQRF